MFNFVLNNCLVNLKSARYDKYKKNKYPSVLCKSVIKRIRAGQPEGLKEFGRLQKDTKTDELMMEDLGKYVIKNREDLLEILQRAGRDETPEEERWALNQLSFMQMSMGSQRARIWLMGTQ